MEWLNYKGVEMSETNGVGKKNGKERMELNDMELNYLVWIKKKKKKWKGMLDKYFYHNITFIPFLLEKCKKGSFVVILYYFHIFISINNYYYYY